jgi:hypothetical protein
MKTIFIKARPNVNGGFFNSYSYAPIRHPAEEWINIFESDGLGVGFEPRVEWDKYDLAFSFCHDGGMGGTTYLRSIAPHLKIVTILEPSPRFYLRREYPSGEMETDILNSNIALVQECYEASFRQYFKTDKIHGSPMPINIPEYKKFINLNERKPIIAATGHCNFSESALRADKIIQEAKKLLKKPFKTRMFYAMPEDLRRAKFQIDEACPFIWDYITHLKRLNECYIMVDDSAGYTGHMCLKMACLGIPSVGSNDFIAHLCPEISFSPRILVELTEIYRKPEEVKGLAECVARLANEESFYKEVVDKMLIRLNGCYSYEVCKTKLLKLLGLSE